MIEKFEEALQKNNCFWKCIFLFFVLSKKEPGWRALHFGTNHVTRSHFWFLLWQLEMERKIKLTGIFLCFSIAFRGMRIVVLYCHYEVQLPFLWSEPKKLYCTATSHLNAFCPDWLIERHELKAEDMFITAIMQMFSTTLILAERSNKGISKKQQCSTQIRALAFDFLQCVVSLKSLIVICPDICAVAFALFRF